LMTVYKTTTEEAKVEVTEVLPRAIPTDFYRLFLTELRHVADQSPLTTEQICTILNLHKNQVSEWMKQAVEEKQVKKLIKPVRYQWAEK